MLWNDWVRFMKCVRSEVVDLEEHENKNFPNKMLEMSSHKVAESRKSILGCCEMVIVNSIVETFFSELKEKRDRGRDEERIKNIQRADPIALLKEDFKKVLLLDEVERERLRSQIDNVRNHIDASRARKNWIQIWRTASEEILDTITFEAERDHSFCRETKQWQGKTSKTVEEKFPFLW